MLKGSKLLRMIEKFVDDKQYPISRNGEIPEITKETITSSASKYLHPGEPYCGIYFLILDDEIVYVGQSRDIKSRISQHSKTDKFWDKFFYILCERDQLNKLESHYINQFKPKYNIAIPKE